MQRALWVALAAATVLGCGTTVDEGFGVALTIRFEDAVGDAQVATVRRFHFVASGDETDASDTAVKRASAQRIERVVYRPRPATRMLTLEVSGIDGNGDLVAIGSTRALALSPGKTTVAEVVLSLPASPDMGPVDDLSVVIEQDLSEPPDLGPADLRRPVPTTIAFPAPSPFPIMPTGTQAGRFLAAGLQNKDAVPDLVVTRVLSPYGYTTLYNDGEGRFPSPTPQTASLEPDGIALGDFNGDGWGDYAIVIPDLVIYLSNSSGAYTPTTLAGHASYSVVAADFDGDGNLDLAIGLTALPDVQVLLGTGMGTFDNITEYPLSLYAYRLGVGDFNGDGKLDISAHNSATSMRLMTNTGVRPVNDLGPPMVDLATTTGPLFTAGAVISHAISAPNKVEVVDVRGDSKPEILLSNANYVYLMDNNAGTLQPGVNLSLGSTSLGAVAAGDLDKDGKSEIAVVDTTYSTLTLFRFGPLPMDMAVSVFQPIRTGFQAPTIADLLMRDLNGDGELDLATVDNTGLVKVHLNASGDFPSLPRYTRAAATYGTASTTGDFDNDGRLDVATVGVSPANVTLFLNRGAGSWFTLPITASATSLAVGDFNSDGKSDLVAANATNFSILENTGSTSPDGGTELFTPRGPYGSTGISAVAVGDFNKDTKADIVYADSTLHKIGIMLNDGAGAFPAATTYAVSMGPNAIAVADFNNDGRVDIAVSCATAANINVLLDSGNGIFGVAEPYGAITSGNHNGVRALHFNADDKLDLTFGATMIGVVINAGNGTFPALVNPVPESSTANFLVVDDFNIDDKHDIAHGALNLLLGTGMGSFQPAKKFPPGGTFVSIVSGDFDADGLSDVVMIHSAASSGGPVFMRNLSR